MPYRAALIGCGKIGSEFADDPRVPGIYSHAGAYAACPATELVAVCDNDPEKLERCGRRWQVEARYRDARRLLEDVRPDIVSICTPDATHAELLELALATPGVRAVLVEKPLATDLESARKLVDLAAERRIVLAVNYSRRYADNHNRLRDFLQAGGIGAIQTVSGVYTRGTLHNGTHWFDLVRWLVGPIRSVWGRDIRREGGSNPTLDAFLEFECGAAGSLHACAAELFSIFELDLIGGSGRVRVIESGNAMEFYHVVDSSYYTGYGTLALKDRWDGPMRDVLLHAVEDVVHCLNQGGKPRCSGADGLSALEVAFAVRESAATGKIITVEPQQTS